MEKQTPTNVKLVNVRLSFPSVFKKAVFNDEETKYEATFLLPKSDTKTKKLIDKVIAELLQQSKVKVSSDKLAIRCGDEIFEEKEYDGYEDHWVIKASSSRRPTVINRDKSPITEEDEIIYGGCYVNAVINFWVQNNKFGKRVNANMLGIQFVKDGEAFGSGDFDATDEFDEIVSDDDDDF